VFFTPSNAIAKPGTKVRTASEYRQYAEECRELARKAGAGEAGAYLLEMAELWNRLACEMPFRGELDSSLALNHSANDPGYCE
jgi:hypothetical protein